MSFAPLVPIGAGTNPAYRVRYSMYEIPPTEKITVEEFEQFSIARLKSEHPPQIIRPIILILTALILELRITIINYSISALKALDNFRISGARGAQLVDKMRPVIAKYLNIPKWYVQKHNKHPLADPRAKHAFASCCTLVYRSLLGALQAPKRWRTLSEETLFLISRCDWPIASRKLSGFGANSFVYSC
jgi:hypothetical protein